MPDPWLCEPCSRFGSMQVWTRPAGLRLRTASMESDRESPGLHLGPLFWVRPRSWPDWRVAGRSPAGLGRPALR